MKVDIIYRCCGKEMSGPRRERRPPWFDKRKCFKSVWQMSEYDPTSFRVHVIYDGPPSSLLDYFRTKRIENLSTVNYNSHASVEFQWDYADKLDGDWLYFVEDDYLHAPGAGRVFMEGVNRFDLFTLYDHLDRYTRTDDITNGKESVAMTPSCHWRTAESTCVTWAISRKLWQNVRPLARLHGNHDRDFFRDLIAHGIRLWTPIPGKSTHCMEGYMSPLVQWPAIAAAIEI